jgi:tetratricopeptide (TPR) repeat protein
MSTEQIVVSTPGLPDESGKAAEPRRRRRVFVVIGLLLIVAPASFYGYQWFRNYQFNAECEGARAAEDWYSLRDSARRWTEWEPTAGRAWWLAAEAAQKLEDHEDLAFCLGQVPATDPNSLVAYTEKANLEWTALNRPLDAMKTSLQVLQLDDRILVLHSRVISFYAMTLQRTRMLKAIRRALAVGAEPKECYTYLVLADFMAFANGADINSRWLAAEPDEVRFKIALAVNTAMSIEQNAGINVSEETDKLISEASQQLQWFLKDAPDDPALLGHLMHSAYKAGDVAGMESLLGRVGAEAADDHMVWLYRAWYHLQSDEQDEALESIQEALTVR